MPRNSFRRPEPLNASGSVLLGYNQLCLLHGLYDRPQGRAESSADLVRAATPYVRLFRDPNWSCIEKATLSLHPAWVEKGRSGRCNTWVLTPRGRAIVERSVPACVRGMGPYEGLAAWREGSNDRRRQECLDARIQAMQRDHDGRELLARLECAMFAWSCFFGPTSMASAYAHENNKRVLRRFLQRYVVRHGAMPRGIHDVGSISLHPSRVDFDLLVGPLPSGRSRAVLVNTSRHIIVRASSNFDVARLRELARAGAEWRDYGLVCEPTVVPDVLRALNATS
jgi:hypothetical protein